MDHLVIPILIADGDRALADALATALDGGDHPVRIAGSIAEVRAALERPEADRPGVLLVESAMPDGDGIELAAELRRAYPALAVVILTGYGSIDVAIAAMRAGAGDLLVKPIIEEELRAAVGKAVQHHALVRPTQTVERTSGDPGPAVIGRDPRMIRIQGVIDAVAESRTTVLMCGESGTGKSLIARAVHERSARADGPFVQLACGSIPETLLESELFGHVRGAFTGAHADAPGRFRAADGGTLFLDEINSASPAMQVKLLRVLQDRMLEPVGSSEPIEVDVRVVLATNEPLEPMVADGRFRRDLYFRINVVTLEIPPLRDRPGDVPLLAEHLLRRKAEESGRRVEDFSDEALAALTRYRFPGNVRELENLIERAVLFCESGEIGLHDLPAHVRDPSLPEPLQLAERSGEVHEWSPTPLREALLEPERRIILTALEANGWNRQQTADQLGINRATLYKKIRQHGLDRRRTG